MKKTLVSIGTLALLFGMALSLTAQTTEAKPPKNSILSKRQDIMVEKKLSPLPEICEEYVMWKKTIIREIDFRQKINQVFYYPVNPTEDWRNFATVIYDGILDGRGFACAPQLCVGLSGRCPDMGEYQRWPARSRR